jgi:penicillin amidase
MHHLHIFPNSHIFVSGYTKFMSMRRFRRILFIAGVIILLVLIAAGIVVHQVGHRALPDYNEPVKLEGMKEEVTVYRDSAAIPHLYAQNEHDLYMATGYLMAQDRLWQMDLLRRVTQGRLSEIFGRSMLEDDLIMRSLRIPRKSEKVLERSGDDVVSALRAFSRGVNAYLKKQEGKLPPEFTILGYKPEPWKPVHSVNLIGYMAWDLAQSWHAEVVMNKISARIAEEKYRQMIPRLDEQDEYVFDAPSQPKKGMEALSMLMDHSRKLEQMGLKVFTGSNNWAVSGERSVTGKPLFANDMHLGLFAPGIWYQVHQVVEGEVNVTGVALPGQPLVISGHNDSIAWGMTNVMLDGMDFYRETLHPGDSTRYRLDGQWKDMRSVQESVAIKGGDTVRRKLFFTHRGPVVSRFKDLEGQTLSMRWIGNEYSNELRAVYRLNRAGDWQAFKQAVKGFTSISQNIAYADTRGNIGMYCCAGVPIREGNPAMIFPGDTSRYDWKGLVPFDELPHQYNPDNGMVSSANNRTVHPDYPYYISHWFDLSPRIDRIRQMLSAKEKLSVDDFTRLQTDHQSLMVPRFKDKIMEVMKEKEGLSSSQQEALGVLEDWEGNYSADSGGAAVFEQFYLSFLRNLIHDELGDELYDEYIGSKILVRNLMKNVWNKAESAWCDDVSTQNRREDFSDMVEKSFQDAVRKLSRKAGEDPQQWRWGRIHRLELKHPVGGEVPVLDFIFDMNRGPYGVGGSFHTVCPYSYSFGNPFQVNHGASHRHVYSAANWDRSQTIIPTGTSGIPASKHYCDQTESYIRGEYRRDLFDKELIRKNARYRTTLSGR